MYKGLFTTNDDPPAELVKLATQDFPFFWIRRLEDIKQGR